MKAKKEDQKGVDDAPAKDPEGTPKARGVAKGKRAEGSQQAGGRRTAPGHGVELETKWPKS